MELASEKVLVSIKKELSVDSELPIEIFLYQGFPKGDKMEFIVQKAVELGVHEIIPVSTKRTIVKLDSKKEAKKIERYNSIALSAAKQANRGKIPVVRNVMSFSEAITDLQKKDIGLIPYELAEGMNETRAIIDSVKGRTSIGIFIGPEGGFDSSEIEKAREAGVLPITLGKRILRTETAGIAVLSILMYVLENGN